MIRNGLYARNRQLLLAISLLGGAACAEPDSREPLFAADCRQAAAEYRAGRATALTAARIRHCDREAAAVVPQLWSNPPGDSAGLGALMSVSTIVLDPRILAAVTRVATDTAKPPNVRALATIIMGRYLDSALTGDIQRTGITGVWWAFPGFHLGAPHGKAPADYAARGPEIRRQIGQIARTDSHPAVRDVAALVLTSTSPDR